MSDATDYAAGDSDFAEWLHAVDKVIANEFGVSLFDLPDRNMRDLFDDGAQPLEAATEIMDEEGEEFEW
jgi:hypothetical protein